jgi:hypothetical protein
MARYLKEGRLDGQVLERLKEIEQRKSLASPITHIVPSFKALIFGSHNSYEDPYAAVRIVIRTASACAPRKASSCGRDEEEMFNELRHKERRRTSSLYMKLAAVKGPLQVAS